MDNRINTPKIYTTEEAAKILHRRPQTLRLWRVRGGGPPYTRYSGNPGHGPVGYPEDLLLDWLNSRTYRSTSDEAQATPE